jgi:phytoene dehydrogenase-like protein
MTGDAVVVGAGPNGLAAAVTLARAGLEVTVLERSDYVGGGAATRPIITEGVWHDVCSAVHPLAMTSEFFRRFRLAERVEMLTPDISYAQPLSRTQTAIAYRDIHRTAAGLGEDGHRWLRLFEPLARQAEALSDLIGNPMVPLPSRPAMAARYFPRALANATSAWNIVLRTPRARALVTGVFAHTIRPIPSLGSAAAGLVLAALGHGPGWPIPRGGSGAISEAMLRDLLAHGGHVETGVHIRSFEDLPPADVTLLDVTPRAFLAMDTHGRLPRRFREAMRRFRYGNAAAKADFVLSDPVPWADERLRQAVTVHVGGTREDVVRSESRLADAGRPSRRPFTLTVQPTVLDDTRASGGRHVLWSYIHVLPGSTLDPREAIIRRIEEFAPGFRETITDSVGTSAAEKARQELNAIGGDIAAGDVSAWQLLARPRLSPTPWDTPRPATYLCSASTVPGPGVHGQCGWLAAKRVLKKEFGIVEVPDLAP